MADEADFPAAHSMDTTWFAIDSRGHIARLSSSEGGAVPLRGFVGDNNVNLESFDEAPLVAALLRRRAETDERLAQLLPDDDQLMLSLAGYLAYLGDIHGAVVLGELGIYHYECFSQMPIPYLRAVDVQAPLDLDAAVALDANSAEQLADARLPIEFANTEVLQPAEWVECSFWGSHYHWWSSDGQVTFSANNPYTDPDMSMDGTWNHARAARDDLLDTEFNFYDAVEKELEWAIDQEAWRTKRAAERGEDK